MIILIFAPPSSSMFFPNELFTEIARNPTPSYRPPHLFITFFVLQTNAQASLIMEKDQVYFTYLLFPLTFHIHFCFC